MIEGRNVSPKRQKRQRHWSCFPAGRAGLHRWLAGALAAAAVLSGGEASSQEKGARAAAAARIFERPYSQAELGIGMLTLPTTEFCLSAPGTCTRGDASMLGYLSYLYRPNADWAIGAGASMGMQTGGESIDSPGGIERSHNRSYLMLDALGRYYALRLGWLEGWIGGTAGMVVINDTYTNDHANPSAPILGPQGVILRTEGMSAGIAMGLGWTFAQNWSVEGMLRSAWWLLPSKLERAPTGDTATLKDQVAMFSLGVAVAYRMGL